MDFQSTGLDNESNSFSKHQKAMIKYQTIFNDQNINNPNNILLL